MKRVKAAEPKPGALVEYAKHFYERRWMWGTSGNLSLKLQQMPLRIAITPSGFNKGRLKPKDLIILQDGARMQGAAGHNPSAETVIHQAIHRALPDCRAVFHVHPVYPTLVSQAVGNAKQLRLHSIDWFEMMKGVGLKENEKALLPIFPNWQDVAHLAREVEGYLKKAKGKVLPAMLIYNHGLTAWGRTLEETRNHLEIMDFVCEYLYLKRLIKN